MVPGASKTIHVYGEDGTASPFACNNFVVSPPCGARGKQSFLYFQDTTRGSLSYQCNY